MHFIFVMKLGHDRFRPNENKFKLFPLGVSLWQQTDLKVLILCPEMLCYGTETESLYQVHNIEEIVA
jgi:hypothetical protein